MKGETRHWPDSNVNLTQGKISVKPVFQTDKTKGPHMYCRDGIGGWGGGYFYNKMKSEKCQTDGTVPKSHRKQS